MRREQVHALSAAPQSIRARWILLCIHVSGLLLAGISCAASGATPATAAPEVSPSPISTAASAATMAGITATPISSNIYDVFFPTAAPGESDRPMPDILMKPPPGAGALAFADAWRRYLNNARLIETGGWRDMCESGDFKGFVVVEEAIGGTWDIKESGGTASAVLTMAQTSRTNPVQIYVSVENGQPRFGGARMRVVDPAPTCG